MSYPLRLLILAGTMLPAVAVAQEAEAVALLTESLEALTACVERESAASCLSELQLYEKRFRSHYRLREVPPGGVVLSGVYGALERLTTCVEHRGSAACVSELDSYRSTVRSPWASASDVGDWIEEFRRTSVSCSALELSSPESRDRTTLGTAGVVVSCMTGLLDGTWDRADREDRLAETVGEYERRTNRMFDFKEAFSASSASAVPFVDLVLMRASECLADGVWGGYESASKLVGACVRDSLRVFRRDIGLID